jgi:periplasmic protein TonB
MSAYTQHDAQFFSRRALIFVIAVGVQVLGFWALEVGLAQRVMRIISAPIQTDIVQQVEKRDQPPPPPPPKMERPPVEVPPPEVQINVPVETTSTAITDVTTHHVAPPPRPVHRVVMTYATLDRRHSPSVDDYYPPVSRRLEEEGTALVHVCVGPNGRNAGLPTLAKSSGSPRLDAAAVKLAANERFIPGTEDGRAIEQCVTQPVKFVLTDN